jgi:hypothetical protein
MNEYRRQKPLLLSYEAIRISQEEKEACKHLDIDHVTVNILNLFLGSIKNIEFKVKCTQCSNLFPKTEKIMKNRFLEGVNG